MPGLLFLSLRGYLCTTLTTDGSVPTDFSDVLCGVLVPMEHQSTKRTGMCPHGKGFGNILSTGTTVLTGITRTDFDYVFCGTCSLLFQNTEELSPSHIGNRSGKVMVLEHSLDVEVLDIEGVELTDKSVNHLVMEVQSGSLNALMGFCQQDFRPGSAAALVGGEFVVPVPLASAFQASLGFAQSCLSLLEQSGIGNDRMVVGEGGEVLDAHIDPDIPAGLL
jgi:hypothetical protein